MLKGNKSKYEVIDKLSQYLEKVNYDKSIREDMIKSFTDKNFTVSRARALVRGTIPFEAMSEEELCLLIIQVYKHYDGRNKEEINPSNFFSGEELKDIQNLQLLEVNDKDMNELVFTNVIKTNEDQYICPLISMEKIAWINNKALYNYENETQRQRTKVVNKSGEVYHKNTIMPQKIDDIKNTILDNKPITNIISINIPKTGKESIYYSPNTNVLKITIDDNTTFNLIDGAHRWLGIVKAYAEKPNMEYNFVFNIMNYTQQRALDFVLIQDKQTPFDQLYVQTVSKADEFMVLAQDINSSGNAKTNSLYNRIGNDFTDVKYTEAYTTSIIFSKAIKYNFNKDELSAFEIAQIKKFLMDSFVYVLGKFESQFENRTKSQEENITTHPNTFIGYIAILSTLYGDNDWQTKILDILNDIDFSVKNKAWSKINMFSERTTDSLIKKISDYFKEII